jgi:tRNA (guanine26-N2/guanine27-N2)-dimethyltransferase
LEHRVVKEGVTLLAVPSLSEPKMLPAFFNPKGRFVRDVSIACYRVFSKSFKKNDLTFADALSGTGARGIRVAKEIESFAKVFLNDTNSKALEFGRISSDLNSIQSRCFFSQMEVCRFLESRDLNNGERFDVVDIDPFGTPSQYVECAMRAVKDGGLLSMTSTDTAVLCGVYPKVGLRKYLGLPLRTDYSHEIGMRLIFGLLALSAMRLEIGIRPVFCHHDMHYFRAYAEINVGNSFSRQNEKQIGFVLHCFSCGYRAIISRDDFFSHRRIGSEEESLSKRFTCPSCKKGDENKASFLSFGGPCWIGKIQSKEFVNECSTISELPLFKIDELDIPLYYDLTALSEKIKTRTPKITDVMNALRTSGYPTSRTRLNSRALRTDAPIETLLEVVRELAR